MIPARPARKPHLFAKEPTRDPLPALSSTADEAKELIRPALCVQVRENRLHVFLPYTSVLADYLDLVAAIEDTCAHLKQPVWLEGYTPAFDRRLRCFSLTPDPGVLEVNQLMRRWRKRRTKTAWSPQSLEMTARTAPRAAEAIL